jgi:hypothetical protein
VQQLSAQNQDLESTMETLKDELIVSHSEAEKSSRELESLRNRALQDSALEAATREREVLELQGELERCRVERDEWEHALLEERVVADEAKAALAGSRRELVLEKDARSREADELQRERERSANLQSVLEDFQSGAQPDAMPLQSILTVWLKPRSMKHDRLCGSTKYSYNKQHSHSQSSNLVHYEPKCVWFFIPQTCAEIFVVG